MTCETFGVCAKPCLWSGGRPHHENLQVMVSYSKPLQDLHLQSINLFFLMTLEKLTSQTAPKTNRFKRTITINFNIHKQIFPHIAI